MIQSVEDEQESDPAPLGSVESEDELTGEKRILGPIATHGGRELSSYNDYPSDMQAAIKVKIMDHQQEVFDSWGEWIEFFEADQMKMNFLTLLQIND